MPREEGRKKENRGKERETGKRKIGGEEAHVARAKRRLFQF